MCCKEVGMDLKRWALTLKVILLFLDFPTFFFFLQCIEEFSFIVLFHHAFSVSEPDNQDKTVLSSKS